MTTEDELQQIVKLAVEVTDVLTSLEYARMRETKKALHLAKQLRRELIAAAKKTEACATRTPRPREAQARPAPRAPL